MSEVKPSCSPSPTSMGKWGLLFFSPIPSEHM